MVTFTFLKINYAGKIGHLCNLEFWHVDFSMDTSLLNFEHAMGRFEDASFGIVTSDYHYTVDDVQWTFACCEGFTNVTYMLQ